MKSLNKEELFDLLSSPKKEEFDEIAFNLFRNFFIKKHQIDKEGARIVFYRFKEIEFYLYNSETNDCPTINRDCLPGQWFLHRYGVDLTFATTEVNSEINGEVYRELKEFGGILIRGIEKVSEADSLVISGPQRCLFELFNCTDKYPELCEIKEAAQCQESTLTTIFKGKRILGHSTSDEDGGNYLFRYYVGNVDWEQERSQICEVKSDGIYHVVWRKTAYKYRDRPLDNDVIVIDK